MTISGVQEQAGAAGWIGAMSAKIAVANCVRPSTQVQKEEYRSLVRRSRCSLTAGAAATRQHSVVDPRDVKDDPVLLAIVDYAPRIAHIRVPTIQFPMLDAATDGFEPTDLRPFV